MTPSPSSSVRVHQLPSVRLFIGKVIAIRSVAAALVLGAVALSKGVATSTASPCPLIIVSSRHASARDSTVDDRLSALREPANPNRVPGPGSLVAVVRTDSLHRPHIFIEDTTRKARRLLLPDGASEPRWSPDGRMIACVAWKSQQEPWVLTIVDVDGGHLRQPIRKFNVMGFSWSPNGQWIAANGAMATKARGILAMVSVSANRGTVVDTLRVLADYEVGWAPDSRCIAISRPTAIDVEEEVMAADLCLIQTNGSKCPLLVSQTFIPSAPRWVDQRHLRYTRVTRGGQESEDIVLELGPR